MTIIIRDEDERDVAAREFLLDEAFGVDRHEKTCERLREGRRAAPGLSIVAECGAALVATVRLWTIKAGSCDALLLGPLAVSEACRGAGLGARLMRLALNRAAVRGHRAVLLVGDAAYYQRFGFSGDFTTQLEMPGPVDPRRFLGLELVAGALAQAHGRVHVDDADRRAVRAPLLCNAAALPALSKAA